MRVAFYAPLKPPDHPVPSGDRRVARLLIEAMTLAGHQVELANRLRSRDGEGDPARQERIAHIGQTRADRLLRRYRAREPDARPDLWFTYHLYYKAPDWIGPRVAAALDIPYVVAEASIADKRAGGPWDAGHAATLAALRQASLVITLNPLDLAALPDKRRVRMLRPFIDTEPPRLAAAERARHRNTLAARYGLDPEQPWLIAVAMMRGGDKLTSYRQLAEAAAAVQDLPWSLILAGEGPARFEVEEAFSALAAAGRVRFAGELDEAGVAAHLAACDLMVWPAANEAYGMALLEAQAAGLPVLAGRTGGVPAVVRDGETGVLTPAGDIASFTAALRLLLVDRAQRKRMAQTAKAVVTAEHTLPAAARRLDALLQEALRFGPVAAPEPEPVAFAEASPQQA